MRGVAFTKKEEDLMYFDSQKVTDKDIERKIRVLLDFGFKKKEIVPMLADMEFASLRALDCFADRMIREKLNAG